MGKLTGWLIGFLFGAVIGAVLVMLFAPMSGPELVGRVRKSYSDTLSDARQAADRRRRELEADLARRRGSTPQQRNKQ